MSSYQLPAEVLAEAHRIADEAPPLTPEIRDKLAILLRLGHTNPAPLGHRAAS